MGNLITSMNRYSIIFAFIAFACISKPVYQIQTVNGQLSMDENQTWLSHEHLLVDFIGADSINPDQWEHLQVIETLRPYLQETKDFGLTIFVDPTPAYLGRDPELLQKVSKEFSIEILTNTGFYGARNNKYIPKFAKDLTAQQLAEIWITEFLNGIGPTGIKPGFMKIGVDAQSPMDTMHIKLIKAAALTHLATGMTIASHTGPSIGLWPQLEVLGNMNIDPSAFIWVHAQGEEDDSVYLQAARKGCWISFDGLGWEFDDHLRKILFAKENNFLDQVLISHDAGWYDPQKVEQRIVGYTQIFEKLIPELRIHGFSAEDIDLLLKVNPVKAYAIRKRLK